MRSDSADQKKDRHGMVNMYYVVPAKIMLHISMETGPATMLPVAEVEPCSTSAFWSRRPPATPCDNTATGRGAVVSRRSLRFWYCESAYACTVQARCACKFVYLYVMPHTADRMSVKAKTQLTQRCAFTHVKRTRTHVVQDATIFSCAAR